MKMEGIDASNEIGRSKIINDEKSFGSSEVEKI